MDIVRATFEKDGYDDFVEMVDKNDSRIIQLFSKYNVPCTDQISNLLDLEMSLQFKKDAEAIEKEYLSFKELKTKIASNISDKDAEFDEEIIIELIELSIEEECKVSDELERCLIYYTSFYTDVPEFNPYSKELDTLETITVPDIPEKTINNKND